MMDCHRVLIVKYHPSYDSARFDWEVEGRELRILPSGGVLEILDHGEPIALYQSFISATVTMTLGEFYDSY